MIPLVAGVIGLVLGLLASPNPAVALMGGGFLAVVAWALTGFKVGAEVAPQASDPKQSASTPAKRGSRFSIDNHGEVSPRQLGAIFVQQSFTMAEATVDMLFKPGKPGTKLPLAQSVAAEPLPARLFLLALLIAAYYIYPMKRLSVDQSTRHEIMDGSIAELASLKKPDGRLFGREDIQGVQEMIVSFYDFLIKELDAPRSERLEQADPKTAPPKSTELLLSFLVSHYNGGGQSSQRALTKLNEQGFYDPAYAAATQTIDNLGRIPSNTLEGLKTTWLTT
jgi:hypothetical protein